MISWHRMRNDIISSKYESGIVKFVRLAVPTNIINLIQITFIANQITLGIVVVGSARLLKLLVFLVGEGGFKLS